MTQYTPIGYLPGQLVGSFERDILCTWKGHLDYTLFYFFVAPTSGEDIGRCRDLLCVELGSVVADVKEAEALGKAIWATYRESILAGSGERISIDCLPKGG